MKQRKGEKRTNLKAAQEEEDSDGDEDKSEQFANLTKSFNKLVKKMGKKAIPFKHCQHSKR